MNIQELSNGILHGKWTCQDLAIASLKAIVQNDQQGKALNTMSEIDPNVLFYARAIDKDIKENGLKSPLHGIPIILKDNIDVKGLHTTAGSYALNDLIATEDAFLTKKLKEAGALIIGKANLSEFAHWMATDSPSGYSSLNGQVVHAYAPGFDPSGSSSGSAVAVSARFVPISIGTETDGSLMSPAQNNAIVTLKPTVGLVSRNNILPISNVQDTAGPMANTVTDIAYVLQAIAGKDENDPATYNIEIKDYISALNTNIEGKRIGLVTYKTNPLTPLQRLAYKQLKTILEEYNCEIEELEYDTRRVEDLELLTYEFKHNLNKYLYTHNSACKTLNDIITFNVEHSTRCLKYGQDLLEASENVTGQVIETKYWNQRLEETKKAHDYIDGIMDKYHLDCLISVNMNNFAPVSGNPCLSLPAIEPNEEDYHPVSYYLMSKAYTEDTLIQVAYAIEQKLSITCIPSWVESKYW